MPGLLNLATLLVWGRAAKVQGQFCRWWNTGLGCRRIFGNLSVRMNIPAGHLHLPPRALCLRHTLALLTAHTDTLVFQENHRAIPGQKSTTGIEPAAVHSGSSKITRDLSLFHRRDCSLQKTPRTNLTLRKADASEHKVLIELIQPYATSWRLQCDVVGLFLVKITLYMVQYVLQKAWHLEIRGRTTHNYMFPAAGKNSFFFTVIKKRLKNCQNKKKVVG